MNFDQSQISDYAEKQHLHWVDDPSNQEEKYRRNAIRKNVLPSLSSIKSDAIQQFVKSADHMVTTERLLADLATLDLQTIQQHPFCPLDQSYGINLNDIQRLGEQAGTQRQANALRYWLQQKGYALNSQKNLQQLLDWSNHGAGDKSELRNDNRVYRVYRQNLFVMPFAATEAPQLNLVWQDLSKPLLIQLSENNSFQITCRDFKKAQIYSDVNILFADDIRQQFSLKKRFQSAAIPHWRRDVTPILIKDNEIVGMVCSVRDDWLILENVVL